MNYETLLKKGKVSIKQPTFNCGDTVVWFEP